MNLSYNTSPPHRKQVHHFDEPGHVHELTFSCYRRRRVAQTPLWASGLRSNKRHVDRNGDAGAMLMGRLRRIDDALYVHFITFSCYHRRRLLDHDQSKRILLGVLNDEVEKCDARCVGFVVMPDHVHVLIWFSRTGQLSRFMQQWKGRSSKGIKQFLSETVPAYAARFPRSDPIWQVRFYSFEVYSPAKIEETLNDMHLNPVRAGLVLKAVEWRWSSARWSIEGRTVGVPIQWAD